MKIRANLFAVAKERDSYCIGKGLPITKQPFLVVFNMESIFLVSFLDNLFLLVLRRRHVLVELHRVIGTARSEVAQRGGIAEHLHQRDEGIQLLRALTETTHGLDATRRLLTSPVTLPM